MWCWPSIGPCFESTVSQDILISDNLIQRDMHRELCGQEVTTVTNVHWIMDLWHLSNFFFLHIILCQFQPSALCCRGHREAIDHVLYDDNFMFRLVLLFWAWWTWPFWQQLPGSITEILHPPVCGHLLRMPQFISFSSGKLYLDIYHF